MPIKDMADSSIYEKGLKHPNAGRITFIHSYHHRRGPSSASARELLLVLFRGVGGDESDS